MVPGPTAFFGDDVAGIGDFNGDGIDDIAVSSRTATGGTGWWGEVNNFAGWDLHSVDVPYEYEPTLPDDFSLSQNYPNPFNPSTEIGFSLPEAAHVRMGVIDVLGQTVETIVDQEYEAGSHTVSWDGTGAPSGIYFYRLRTDEFSDTKKMVLLKSFTAVDREDRAARLIQTGRATGDHSVDIRPEYGYDSKPWRAGTPCL